MPGRLGTPTDIADAGKEEIMMQDSQTMMGSGMGWTMGLGSLLIIILLLLGVAALIKYVFFR